MSVILKEEEEREILDQKQICLHSKNDMISSTNQTYDYRSRRISGWLRVMVVTCTGLTL